MTTWKLSKLYGTKTPADFQITVNKRSLVYPRSKVTWLA